MRRVFYYYKKRFSHSASSYFHTRQQLNKDSISPTLEARVIADDYCGKERTWSSLVSISSQNNDLSMSLFQSNDYRGLRHALFRLVIISTPRVRLDVSENRNPCSYTLSKLETMAIYRWDLFFLAGNLYATNGMAFNKFSFTSAILRTTRNQQQAPPNVVMVKSQDEH